MYTASGKKQLRELASAVDLMIVEGYNSSNTRKLTEISKVFAKKPIKLKCKIKY